MMCFHFQLEGTDVDQQRPLMLSILHLLMVMLCMRFKCLHHRMRDKTKAILSNDSKLIDFNRIEKSPIAFDGWLLPLFIAHYPI